MVLILVLMEYALRDNYTWKEEETAKGLNPWQYALRFNRALIDWLYVIYK